MVLDSQEAQNQSSDLDNYNSQDYSTLLNRQELKKDLKQNPWSYELNPILKNFLNNIHALNQTLKFRVSGKILDSSTYVLKTKANRIIDHSLETQEDIQEAQLAASETELLNEEEIVDQWDTEDIYDDDNELFEAFSELEDEGFLSKDQRESIKQEKIDYLLNLEASELNKRLEKYSKMIQAPPKILYKKIQMEDLGTALKEVLESSKEKQNSKETIKKKKKIDKSKIPFLPEKLLGNAEQKRALFDERIEKFYLDLKNQYTKDPISFIAMVGEATAENLVESVLIILHLINKKKIQLWTQVDEDENQESRDNGKDIYLSPL